MKEELDLLIKAINIANLEGVKVVETEISDLMFLQSVIKDQQTALKKLNRDIHILEAKISIQSLKKPVRLRVYA